MKVMKVLDLTISLIASHFRSRPQAMALLQRSNLRFSRCTSTTSCSSPAIVVTAPLPLRSRVQMQAPKAHRLALCRASSHDGSSTRVLPPRDAAPMIFKDDSNGIICYYDESGDVTCEGWDEGPHFQPDPQQPSLRRRRRFAPRAMQGRGGGETVVFTNIQGRMGESLREVANESLECSEL